MLSLPEVYAQCIALSDLKSRLRKVKIGYCSDIWMIKRKTKSDTVHVGQSLVTSRGEQSDFGANRICSCS